MDRASLMLGQPIRTNSLMEFVFIALGQKKDSFLKKVKTLTRPCQSADISTYIVGKYY